MSSSTNYVVLEIPRHEDVPRVLKLLGSSGFNDYMCIPHLYNHHSVKAHIDVNFTRKQIVVPQTEPVVVQINDKVSTPSVKEELEETKAEQDSDSNMIQYVGVREDNVGEACVVMDMENSELQTVPSSYNIIKPELAIDFGSTIEESRTEVSVDEKVQEKIQNETSSVTVPVHEKSDESKLTKDCISENMKSKNSKAINEGVDSAVLSKTSRKRKPSIKLTLSKIGRTHHPSGQKANILKSKSRKTKRPKHSYEDGEAQCLVCLKTIPMTRKSQSGNGCFNRSSMLRHSKTHCGIHEFWCSIEGCLYSSTDSTSVRKHMRNVHGNHGNPITKATAEMKEAWKKTFTMCFPTMIKL